MSQSNNTSSSDPRVLNMQYWMIQFHLNILLRRNTTYRITQKVLFLLERPANNHITVRK